MNFKEVVTHTDNLIQTDFCGSKFGNNDQLEVLYFDNESKQYVLFCSVCTKDPELFGEGYFKSTRQQLTFGVPCGCSRIPKWKKEQYEVLLKRKAPELKLQYISMLGEYRGAHTKIRLSCEKHGHYDTNTITGLLNKGRGCPRCKADKISERMLKPDDELIKSFFNSGMFHPDTQFKRSAKTNKHGYKTFWEVFCPVCGQTAVAAINSLQMGVKSCGCKRTKQTLCYINLIQDDEKTIAIKYGITGNFKRRFLEQKFYSSFKIENYGIWSFSSHEDCISAENECQEIFDVPAVSKSEVGDGYTETTYIHNLDKVISIYESYGGVRIYD